MSKIGKVVDQLQLIPRWKKKDGELWSTNKKVIGAHIDPPKWNSARFQTTFHFDSLGGGCCERHLNHPKLSLQSDLRRRVALRWALPHISSFCARQLYRKRAYAIAIPSVRPSVCLSVCLSVTRVIHAKTAEVRIMQFSPYSSPILLVFAH